MRKSSSQGSAQPELRVDPTDRPARAGGGGKAGPKPKPARRKTGRKAPAPTGRRRGWLGRVLVWSLSLMIWAGVALVGLVAYYAVDLPDIAEATEAIRRPSLTFVSADGESFATYGDVYGDMVRLTELPRALPHAVIAVEDRRFYDHFGVDPFGLGRAILANLMAGRVVQGGSTLTQQLAKNLFLTPERSLKRKVQELLMALWLEREFSKDQILTLYLNRVYLGAGTYGVDAAARRYFDVPAARLSLYQSAMIAGLLKAPSRYNPAANPELAAERAAVVLRAMVDAGFLTPQQAEAAKRGGTGPLRRYAPGGRYFADWLHERVQDYVGAGAGDLTVTTTLDMGLQRVVEAELAGLLDGAGARMGAGQGAVVVMTHDGAIRAMAGGRDYGASQFNRATQALRQPGSAFKPFVFLTALEAGMAPDDAVEDRPVVIGKWRPGNYDGKYHGTISLREAAARSSNAVAARLTDRFGPRAVIGAARRLGITTEMPADASLALGTGEVTLLELTAAYAAFASGGLGAWPYGIDAIRGDGGGTVFARDGGGPGRLIAPEIAARMNALLGAVVSGGTGKAAAFGHPAAGKTGTTSDYKDAWFIGYTAHFVAGVWIGNDDGSAMNKVTGGSLPAQLWNKVMTAAHRGLPPTPLPSDDGGGRVPAGEPDEPAAAGRRGPQPYYEGQPQYGGDPIGDLWNDLVKRLSGD